MKLSEFYTKKVNADNLIYFITACTQELNFHPDNDFKDYIESIESARCFTDEQAEILNTRIEEAFNVSDELLLNLYEITIEALKGEDGKQY